MVKLVCGTIEVILGDWEEALVFQDKEGNLVIDKNGKIIKVLKNPKEIPQERPKSEGNTPRGRTKGSQRKKKNQAKPIRTPGRTSDAEISPFREFQAVSEEKTSQNQRRANNKKVIDPQTSLEGKKPAAQAQANPLEPGGVTCLKICPKVEIEKFRSSAKTITRPKSFSNKIKASAKISPPESPHDRHKHVAILERLHEEALALIDSLPAKTSHELKGEVGVRIKKPVSSSAKTIIRPKSPSHKVKASVLPPKASPDKAITVPAKTPSPKPKDVVRIECIKEETIPSPPIKPGSIQVEDDEVEIEDDDLPKKYSNKGRYRNRLDELE